MASIRFLVAASTVTGSRHLLRGPTGAVFGVHGEPSALADTQARLAARGVAATIPRHGEEIALG